jgi:hypothetical protein
MKIAYFAHALSSCWNHGNAHFLRGVLRELVHAGHEVLAFEPKDAWSRAQLVSEQGRARATHGAPSIPSFPSPAWPSASPSRRRSTAWIW